MDDKTKKRIADEVMGAAEKAFKPLRGCQVYAVSVLYMGAEGDGGMRTFTVMPEGTPSLRKALSRMNLLGRMAIRAEVAKAMQMAGQHVVQAFAKLLNLPAAKEVDRGS